MLNILKTLNTFQTIYFSSIYICFSYQRFYNLEFLPEQKFKYDYNQAKESRTKILAFISNACKTYKLDSNNVFVMGFSQGAIMGYDLALAAPKKIKGVLAFEVVLLQWRDVVFHHQII